MVTRTATADDVEEEGEAVVLRDSHGRPLAGVIVGGVPVGTDAFVSFRLEAKASEIISDIESTVAIMRQDSPHATWALLYYSLQCRFDYWLRHVPPEFCWEPASRIDAALERAATAMGSRCACRASRGWVRRGVW